MAVKLRLKRMGAKKRPFYRIVAADSRSPRDGKFIEIVGTYDPLLKTDDTASKVTLKEDLVIKWLNNGAEPTDTVRSLLKNKGILEKIHNEKANKKSEK